MATAAIDWHPVITQIKTILEASAATVGGTGVNYYLGAIDVVSNWCPLGVISAGDEELTQVELGKDASSGRKSYRETKQILVTLATYKVAAGSESNAWANAHGQLEDLLKAVKDAISADTTLGGTVVDSTLIRTRKDLRASADDEVLHVAELELSAWKNWY